MNKSISKVISNNNICNNESCSPQPHEPWTTVLDGTSEASKPIQREYVIETVIGAEDCLFLNVFTKEINPSKLKPVFVWIYGGGFVRGSTSKDVYSPDYFLSKDVVFVSIAYRVGIFGFLSMKDPSLKIPGNAGLKDQILGLKWVQQNISRFGGDPNNVTIFGESAGGASVHFLGLTEKARGLFHQMICMSGSAFCNWALPPPKNWSLRIAKDLGYKGEDNDSAVLHFLRKADCKKIAISEANILTKQEMLEGYLWCSYPVVEPYKSDDCVLPEQPLILARDAWSNDIPVIVGGTSREGIFFVNFFLKSDARGLTLLSRSYTFWIER
ncbi:esterase B1-like [Hermetia illucens]|uniref:esterase B1-like n=1 Tax=Hermetia illucens TaxID=343691 RepID=UPI0018CC40C8|nr:esterase B1-like [Hermetia illucens]